MRQYSNVSYLWSCDVVGVPEKGGRRARGIFHKHFIYTSIIFINWLSPYTVDDATLSLSANLQK